jgi:hypothetical protein
VSTFSPLDSCREVFRDVVAAAKDNSFLFGVFVGIAISSTLIAAIRGVQILIKRASGNKEYDPTSPQLPSTMEKWSV